MGLPLDHKTGFNWHIKVCEYYLSSLYELLRKELLKPDVIHADERPYRVLDSERAKDYVWTFLSGKHAEKPIVLYHHGSRKGAEAWDFLAGFMINILPKDKAIESDATSVANQEINYCSQMFSLECVWEDLSAE